jgi:hypothetical protein
VDKFSGRGHAARHFGDVTEGRYASVSFIETFNECLFENDGPDGGLRNALPGEVCGEKPTSRCPQALQLQHLF